jgi:excisionase family DNA binding protein
MREGKDRLITPEEAALRLSMAPKTIKDYLRLGKIPGVKVGKVWRLRESDVEQIIEKGL